MIQWEYFSEFLKVRGGGDVDEPLPLLDIKLPKLEAIDDIQIFM